MDDPEKTPIETPSSPASAGRVIRPQPRLNPDADENGVVGDLLVKLLGRSWRTTLLGLVTIACGAAVSVPGMPSIVVDICRIILPVSTGGGLMLAKDTRVSGTDRAASSRRGQS